MKIRFEDNNIASVFIAGHFDVPDFEICRIR